MPAPHELKTSIRFNGLKQEVLLVISLIFIMLFIELMLRSQASNLSGNIRHIRQIPEIASRLNQQTPSLLFLGNSLTNNGIDPAVFQARLPDLKTRIVEKIVPDASSLSDWYCIVSNNIASLDHPPRVLVVGFAWLQLSDQYPVNASRLGGFFCSVTDTSALSAMGLTNHTQVLDFLAGAGSQVYLNREAIRNRLLDVLVPNFRSVTQEMNANPGLTRKQPNTQAPIVHSHSTLIRFSRMAQETGIKLVLVAMPVKDEYQLNPDLVETVKKHQIAFLDMRHTPGLENNMYLDPIHLNEVGRHRFSLALANALPGAIRNAGDKTGFHVPANNAHSLK
jgi:hypothetical protein